MANAISMFKQVVDLNGNDKFGLFNLGEAYNASGNKKEAKKINDRLKKLDPAMASMLNDIFDGKIPTMGVPVNVPVNVPKVPKLPKFP